MGSIRDEIQQTRPFASAADEAVVTLLGTADRVRAALSRVVEAHGITLQQYNVLRILRGAGPEGLPTLEIAARMIEHSPGITRLLDRLEASGLVRRERCPEDRRQVLCHATDAGPPPPRRARRPRGEAGRRLLAPLDPPRTAELVRLLDAVRAATASPSTRTTRPKTTRTRRRRKEGEPMMKTRFAAARRRPGGPPPPSPRTPTSSTSRTPPSASRSATSSRCRRQVPDFSGTIKVDRAKPESSSVEFTIQAASIYTNEPSATST